MAKVDTSRTGIRPFSDIPEMPSGRLLGHLGHLRRDPLGMFLEARRRHGDIVRLRMGHRTILLVTSPELVHRVLVEGTDTWIKGTRGYILLRTLLGSGLLTSQGELWKQRRRLAQPAFHRRRLAGFADTMVRQAHDRARSWDVLADTGVEVDMFQEMNTLALAIACETLFGTDSSERAKVVGECLETALKCFETMVSIPMFMPEKLPLPVTRRYIRARATLHEVVDGIIAERRASGEDRDDLLGMFMAARDEDGAGLDDVALRDELVTMMLAGHETTANALSWALYALSVHPGVARRLQREVDAVCGGAPPALEHLSELVEHDHVVRETLRLYPPAWSISRASVADDVLAGYHVPRGTFVFTSPYAVHRHPDLWDNPEGFDPDRWADDDRPRLAWYPFGAGQRKCIGEGFAMMETRLVLATLVQRFQYDLVPGAPVEPEPSVTLRMRHGLPMTLRRRQAQPLRAERAAK